LMLMTIDDKGHHILFLSQPTENIHYEA